MSQNFFPEIVTTLPQADVHGEGVRAYLLQGEGKQVAFVAFDDHVDAPEESHEAQWGAVLAGEIELTIGEETFTFRPGDTYFVPAGVPHGARIKAGSRLMDLFGQVDRFRVK